MTDLYTRFCAEFDEKVKDVRKLLAYLSDSYYGAEDDLKRIRMAMREMDDLKHFYISKNEKTKGTEARSFRTELQTVESLNYYINTQIEPFMRLFKFLIELYEESI